MAIAGADGNIYYHDDEERYNAFNCRWDEEYARRQRQSQHCRDVAPHSASQAQLYRHTWMQRDHNRLAIVPPTKRSRRRHCRGRQSSIRRHLKWQTIRRQRVAERKRQQTIDIANKYLDLHPVTYNEWDQ
jgi:hypothetical protein